jgi:outer membrane receptor protein involved in Fe transport
MKFFLPFACLSLAAWAALPTCSVAAEVDARPPDRLTVTAAGSKQIDFDNGGAGSLNWLHYFTPGLVFGLGAEHQFIGDATLSFGTARGAYSRGEGASKFSVFGEMNYGEGDDGLDNTFDYSVAVLGVAKAITPKFFVELESRQIDIDTSHGNLPKLGLTYVWTPHFLTYVSYAESVGGNLGTDLTSARIEYLGSAVNLKLGGSTGRADPAVIIVGGGALAAEESIVRLPAVNSKQGFIGIGKTFKRGEVQLIGDYLESGDIEKVTITLSYAAFIGSRAR